MLHVDKLAERCEDECCSQARYTWEHLMAPSERNTQ